MGADVDCAPHMGFKCISPNLCSMKLSLKGFYWHESSKERVNFIFISFLFI